MPPFPLVVFGSPRKLPKTRDVQGKVAVVDIAFASEASGGGFEKITKAFIDGLGSRLVAWVDHHDSTEHARYRGDRRFVLSTKAEHGACPEMITRELVARFGPVDTIVCHTDFDGMVSAAKYMRGGDEPYGGADDDARAIDTRIGKPSAIAERFDRAIRARPKDLGLFGLMVRHLATGLEDTSLWAPIDEAAREMAAIEEATRRAARGYARLEPGVALVDVSQGGAQIDKTLLLLMGQEREPISVVVDRDTITLAARFDSGINFLTMLGLSGGMPTRVSVPRAMGPKVWESLRVDRSQAERVLASGLLAGRSPGHGLLRRGVACAIAEGQVTAHEAHAPEETDGRDLVQHDRSHRPAARLRPIPRSHLGRVVRRLPAAREEAAGGDA